MTNYKKSLGNKLPQRFLQNAIIKLLRKKPGKPYSVGNLSLKLKTKNSKDSIKIALGVLLADKKIIKNNHDKYIIHPNNANTDKNVKSLQLEGRVDLTASGGAYVIVDGQERDIYIPPKRVNGALQGDTGAYRNCSQSSRKTSGRKNKSDCQKKKICIHWHLSGF